MRKCLKLLMIFSRIPGNVCSLLVLVFALVIRQVDVIVDVSILEYLAARLKPQECSRIVSYSFNPSTQSTMDNKSYNDVECLRQLVDWTSELKLTRGDIQVVLGNRLRQIGRDDLAAWLIGPSRSEGAAVGRQIAERENFGIVEELSSEDKVKDQNQTAKKTSSSLDTTKKVKGKNQRDEKIRLQQLSELHEDHCLKIPLSTALIFIGITMLLTCCCALLCRNRAAACINKLRGKNKKKSSRKISLDEERGVMIPKRKRKLSVSLSKVDKKRTRAPSEELVNTGTQNSDVSVTKDDEETPTGCCRCCRKKKKKSGKKRKK